MKHLFWFILPVLDLMCKTVMNRFRVMIIILRLRAFLQDALPIEEMNPAEVHCEMADVVLCLGTR